MLDNVFRAPETYCSGQCLDLKATEGPSSIDNGPMNWFCVVTCL